MAGAVISPTPPHKGQFLCKANKGGVSSNEKVEGAKFGRRGHYYATYSRIPFQALAKTLRKGLKVIHKGYFSWSFDPKPQAHRSQHNMHIFLPKWGCSLSLGQGLLL